MSSPLVELASSRQFRLHNVHANLHVNERMNDCRSERTNELMNERTNELMKEETNERTHRTDYRTDGLSERARGGGNTGAGRHLHAHGADFLHGESQSSESYLSSLLTVGAYATQNRTQRRTVVLGI